MSDFFGNPFGWVTDTASSVGDFFDSAYKYVSDSSGSMDVTDSGSISDNHLFEAGADAVKSMVSGGVSKTKSSELKKPRYMDAQDANQFGTSVSSPQYKASQYSYKESVNFVAIEQQWIERMREFAQLGEKVK